MAFWTHVGRILGCIWGSILSLWGPGRAKTGELVKSENEHGAGTRRSRSRIDGVQHLTTTPKRILDTPFSKHAVGPHLGSILCCDSARRTRLTPGQGAADNLMAYASAAGPLSMSSEHGSWDSAISK